MWGLGNGPSLKIGLSEWPLTDKTGDFGTKITKKNAFVKREVFWSNSGRKRGTQNCIFLKRGVFWSGPGRKSSVFRSGPGRNIGALRQHMPLVQQNPALGFLH